MHTYTCTLKVALPATSAFRNAVDSSKFTLDSESEQMESLTSEVTLQSPLRKRGPMGHRKVGFWVIITETWGPPTPFKFLLCFDIWTSDNLLVPQLGCPYRSDDDSHLLGSR